MKIRKLLVASVCAVTVIATTPTIAQDQRRAEQGFFSTLLSTGVPSLEQLAISGLSFLVKKVGKIIQPNKPSVPSSPALATPETAAPPRAALAYTVYRVDKSKQVTIAGSADRYQPGEGVTIAVTNNLPGILDVDNIDAAGKRVTLESVPLTSIRQILLPARTQGYYVVNADSSGDERLELRFFPCRAVVAESMAVREDKAVAELAQQTALKADVAKALGPCPTKTERDAVKSVHTESMAVFADTQVANAAQALTAASKNPLATPVFITVTVGVDQ